MITNVSLVTVYVTDQDEAKKFYTEVLGFEARADATLGDYRWVTVGHPDHRELEITLMVPGPPLDDELAEVVRRALANGRMGSVSGSMTARKRTRTSVPGAWNSRSRPQTARTASRP